MSEASAGKPRSRAVIFDLGGTLIHYERPGVDMEMLAVAGLKNLYAGLAALGYALPPPQAFIAGMARHLQDTMVQAGRELRAVFVETALRERLAADGLALADPEWARVRGRYYEPIHQVAQLRPGAREALAVLEARDFALGLASNTFWSGDVHDRHLTQFGLLEFLPVRVYSSAQQYIKPHPEFFRVACAAVRVAPDEAVYVGDRVREDVLGAQAAGLRAVLVRSPYREEPLDDVGPAPVIHELGELAHVI